MEAFFVHGKSDQYPHSPHKPHIIARNPRKIQPQVFQRLPFDDIFPPNPHSMGLLQSPPPPVLARSYPPYPLRPPPQPPLLPLPPATVNLCRSSSTLLAANRNINRSQNPKKYKSPKKEKKKTPKISPSPSSTGAATVISSTGATEPDRKELPNNAGRVFPAGPRAGFGVYRKNTENTNNQEEIYSPGSMAYTASPPPSSLPLPSFCFRPNSSNKLISCNAEAGGVNDGASDSLRQILRLK